MTHDFRTAAVIGAGTIGLSWTTLFAAHGLTVHVTDPAPTSPKPSTRPWPTSPRTSRPGAWTSRVSPTESTSRPT